MAKRSRSSSSRRSHSRAPITPFFCAVAAYLVACLVLGGGTRAGFISDVILQVLAVPLLLWAAWRLLDIPEPLGGRQARAAIVVCLMLAALPMAQLVPLPPSVWTALPGRADLVSVLPAAGLEIGWLPLSLSPRGTWLSALALLPPAAILLSTMLLGYADRRRLALVFVIVGMAALGLGLLQLAQGPASPLRFFAYTNPLDTVGFFANRNHHAALLNCVVPFAAALSIEAMRGFARAGWFRSRSATRHVVVALLGCATLVMLVAGQAMTRSRAGLGLMLVALLGALAMAYAQRPQRVDTETATRTSAAARKIVWLVLAAIAIVPLLSSQFVFDRLQGRFAGGLFDDGRVALFDSTFEAVKAYMPFGSGVGTFGQVYPAFEKPSDGFAGAYVNRAHNEYLELWLEAGLPGLLAMLLFLAWHVRTSLRVWRRGLPGAGRRDNLLACAATLVLILLLAHSIVDYPLRTAALMVVFAMAAALMLPPVGMAEGAAPRLEERTKSAEVAALAEQSTEEPVAASSGPLRRAAIPPRGQWPAAWQSPRNPGNPDDPAAPQ